MRLYSANVLFSVTFSLIVQIFVIRNCNACNRKKDAGTDPEVSIPQGKLRGLNIVTNHGRVIHGFMGIPYAQPPIGNLRFRAPLAADAWTGTLNATKDASICPQVHRDGLNGEEDCLYLNVYTPQLPFDGSNCKTLPVMVWIHGGAFCRGTGASTQASPKYILDKDVLLVVPNFRLGPLGFLSTGDEVSPGNYGLKDQVLALKWIQTNIEYFGGDPSQVTLFGLSTGAVSVNLLALSESANGLFHKYIKISGSALSPRAYVPRTVLAKHSYLLGEHLGCFNTTSTALVNCLRKLNAMQIANTTSLFLKWDKHPDMVWRPTDEPDVEGAFLTDSPTNLYATGKIRDLPCISGVVRDEGLHFSSRFYEHPNKFDDFLNRIDEVLPYMLLYQDREDASSHTAALKAYYLNDLTADREVLLANITQLIGDAFYIYPTHSAQRKQLILGKSPQYLYSFEYLRTSRYSNDTVVAHGIQHADDETFLFPINPAWCERETNCELSGADSRMIDIAVGLWTSFAINGVPTLDSEHGVTWSPYSAADNYLRIGNGPDLAVEVMYSFFKERMQFWNDLTTPVSSKSDA